MSGKIWTTEELDYIKDNIDSLSFKEIALQLGKTESSVQLKANRIGLKRGKKAQKANNLSSDDSLKHVFKSIKNRAYSKNYSNYIGNGIVEEWKIFSNFRDWAIQYWSKTKRLRVIDNNKPFGPDNCIFVEVSEIASENSLKGLDKKKETCLEKYGKENFTQTEEYLEKKKKTSQEKYGVDHPVQCKEIQDKIKQTCLGKYGAENPFMNKEIQEKARKTFKKNTGYDHPSQDPIIRQKQIDTLIQKYGTVTPSINGKTENELRNWINSLGFSFKEDWKILSGKQLDLYDIDQKLAIEYCGLYWHTELSPEPRTKNYHYNKYLKCKEQNIQLITIFSDEWIKRQNQVKSFLKARLGIYDNTYYARNCIVKEIHKDIANSFIDEFHIQGKKNSKKYFGITYNDELLGIISFALHHRDSSKLILDRMVFRDGIRIIGGVSKIITHSIDWILSEGFTQIITWSDNRWTEGFSYERSGFILDKELGPDYSYVFLANPRKRFSKQSMKKKDINCPSNITELEFTKELGYARIWDCGKKRWIYNIK